MSVSGVAGPTISRNWTPILNRRDDSTQAASPTSPDQTTNTSDQTGAPTTPAFGLLNQMPSNSIMVSLPNGMSVGIAHLGGGSSGFDAQMLASLEELVGNLSRYATTKSTGDGTQPNAASDGPEATGSNSDMKGMQAIDMMHVDLPNGISVEIRHSSATPEADGGLAAMNEMEKAMEELVDHFSSMAGSADSGSTAANSASQRALAAYAAQATQKDDAALTAGLGVSKAS